LDDDVELARQLRAFLVRAAVASTVAAPVSHSRLLEMIVSTAASVINAQAASLFLIDDEAQELVFEVALGAKAEAVKNFRVPLGHGIAGLVALSGQPMATSGASDPRQARDIAESVGYLPQSILCVPLFYSDRVIGVLELLDKIDAPSFSTTDMHVLGLFANQAAVAIEQSRTRDNLAAFLVELLIDMGVGLTDDQRKELRDRARRFASRMEEDERYRQSLDLARVVEEISQYGEHELNAVQAILRDFAEYLRSRPKPFSRELTLGDSQW
jgi:GAF domain-containing protein